MSHCAGSTAKNSGLTRPNGVLTVSLFALLMDVFTNVSLLLEHHPVLTGL